MQNLSKSVDLFKRPDMFCCLVFFLYITCTMVYFFHWTADSVAQTLCKKEGIRSLELGVVFAVPAAAVVLCPSCSSVLRSSKCLFLICVHLTGNQGDSSKAGLICIIFQTLSKCKVSYLILGINIFQKSMPITNEFYKGRKDSLQLNANMSLI